MSCLGNILQVEDSWKQTEFIVLPHRDSKDVFILGGIDDIQALLDDSMVIQMFRIENNQLIDRSVK